MSNNENKNINTENSQTGNEKTKKCFVMMPISKQKGYEDDENHFTKVYEQIFKPAIKKAGFEPFRVDEDKISDSIINKIFDAIQNSAMALCDLSAKNPNVLYELGLRQAYDLPVVLVKDEKTGTIFDVSGINTVEYNSHRLVENVTKAIDDISKALIATYNGDITTVVKIVKAKVANFDDVVVSDNDNIKITLNGIMAELKSIKKYQEKTQQDNIDIIKGYTGDYKREFVVKLKKGTTNKFIYNLIDNLRKEYGVNIEFLRNNDYLTVELSGLSSYYLERIEVYIVSQCT